MGLLRTLRSSVRDYELVGAVGGPVGLCRLHMRMALVVARLVVSPLSSSVLNVLGIHCVCRLVRDLCVESLFGVGGDPDVVLFVVEDVYVHTCGFVNCTALLYGIGHHRGGVHVCV